MNFTAAARCMHELRCIRAMAGGAADEIEVEIKNSSFLPPESKEVLLAMVRRLFPTFGVIDIVALDTLENQLLQFNDFASAYTVRRLQNTPLTDETSE